MLRRHAQNHPLVLTLYPNPFSLSYLLFFPLLPPSLSPPPLKPSRLAHVIIVWLLAQGLRMTRKHLFWGRQKPEFGWAKCLSVYALLGSGVGSVDSDFSAENLKGRADISGRPCPRHCRQCISKPQEPNIHLLCRKWVEMVEIMGPDGKSVKSNTLVQKTKDICKRIEDGSAKGSHVKKEL